MMIRSALGVLHNFDYIHAIKVMSSEEVIGDEPRAAEMQQWWAVVAFLDHPNTAPQPGIVELGARVGTRKEAEDDLDRIYKAYKDAKIDMNAKPAQLRENVRSSSHFSG